MTPIETPEAIAPPPLPRESLVDLFRRLIDNIADLVRSELQLARTEFRASVSNAAGSLAAVAVGGMLAMVATSCLLVAAIAWLATKVGLVASALIVAGVFGVLAAILIVIGVSRLQNFDLAPKRTAANLKRTADMLKGD